MIRPILMSRLPDEAPPGRVVLVPASRACERGAIVTDQGRLFLGRTIWRVAASVLLRGEARSSDLIEDVWGDHRDGGPLWPQHSLATQAAILARRLPRIGLILERDSWGWRRMSFSPALSLERAA